MRRQAIKAGASGRPMPKWLARQRRLRDRLSLTARGSEALRREITWYANDNDELMMEVLRGVDESDLQGMANVLRSMPSSHAAVACRIMTSTAAEPSDSETRRRHLTAEYVRQFGDLPGEADDVVEQTLRLIGAAP